MKTKKIVSVKPGYQLVFRMWFKHPKTGKIIHTGRPIPMWVKITQ